MIELFAISGERVLLPWFRNYRLGKTSFVSPPGSLPIGDDLLANAELCGPISRAKSLIAERQKDVGSTVASLFESRCPSAVARLVIAVVVNALKCQLRRGFSHIGKKIFVSSPSVANRNPATSIGGIFLFIRIKAALAHAHPQAMRSRAGKAVMFTVWSVWMPSVHTV
jgi:hypothetical protein